MDEDVLRVGGSSPVNQLASAIAHSVYQGKPVSLRCIGAASVNQAVKALAVAQGFVGPKGVTLAFRPGFVTIKMDSGEDVSAILLRVIES